MLNHYLPSNHIGIFSILFASTLWGTTGTVASFAPNISPLAIGAFSMGFGGIFQAYLWRKQLKVDFKQILQTKKIVIVSVIALVIYPLTFYSSMRLAGIAIGTVISIATAPFFTALLECLFSKHHKVDRQWLLHAAIGIAGIMLLVLSEPSGESASHQSLRWFGVLLGLIAGLSYAIYSWGAKSMIDEGIQSQSAMGSIFGLGATLLLPTLFITGDNLFASSNNIVVIIYMALLPMGVGYIAYGFGLRSVSVSNANLLTLFEPVVAAILAVLIIGEHISIIGWLGMVLIMICLLLQSRHSAFN